MPAELLVTGCYRSGTTLLEKLLHSQPDASVASQPFPALYSLAKERFDAARGAQPRYPLGHRFLEDGYSDADFAAHLDSDRLGPAELDQLFQRLAADRNGLWTPAILGARGTIRPGAFLDVYRQMLRAAVAPAGRLDARVIGSKEILVEEYVPYLLARGVHVVLIVRDPRDMIASLNFSERDNATGLARPVLFSVRIWRKSVATVLAHEGHARFKALRYEDLVADPDSAMSVLRTFLGLPAIGRAVGTSGLLDQGGRDWQGNSSFGDRSGVSQRSVGTHSERLPPSVRSLIETAAAPEMAVMGYDVPARSHEAIASYRDPFETIHPKFPADYSRDAARVRDEIQRLTMLSESRQLPDPVASRWFIYPEAYRKLRMETRQAGSAQH